MIFMCTYQLDRDKQAETQAFFANMTDEQIAGEYPADVKPIGRWHDAANGSGLIIVDTDNQDRYSMDHGWSGACTFPSLTSIR